MTRRWTGERAAEWPRRPGPADDKYRRGVPGLRIGSARYPGAAVLGATAAWRAGAGLVRYVPPLGDAPGDAALGLPSPAAAVLAARPETVFGAPAEGARPCDAWVIGSGTDAGDRSAEEREALLGILSGPAPVVADAGALDLVAAAAARGRLTAPVLVTPHAGECARLWRKAGLGPLPGAHPERVPDELELRAQAASRLAGALGAAVLLKGSVTLCAAPGHEPIAVGPATPWLAAAGTGDVLAGLLGALVAGRADRVREDPEPPAALAEIGATAALLHDRAARHASGDAPGHGAGTPITALEVAEALPEAVRGLLALT